MARIQSRKKPVKKTTVRSKTSFITRVLILLLLAATGWNLYRLQGQVEQAQAEKDALSVQVETQQQENDALAEDIAEGNTKEKMEKIARDELGLVAPGERVFYDVSN